ncbi:nose resistant to fluoxetine protein 6 isoform X3 [Monomorium pharaonis]|uniref:nose resistant to fluoxetine protein 6 isoform X3 n=1 Tax=Monomorium pharaonis TaxID=307658 RepID=UPI001746342E|nr:nose resistant to fluoxetine protein 6 isoform X3 [Monomorium pharaonis]
MLTILLRPYSNIHCTVHEMSCHIKYVFIGIEEVRMTATEKSPVMLYRQFQFTWCIYISLVLLLCVSVHTQEFNGTSSQISPVYVIASKADFLNSTTCGKELQSFRDAVNHRILWSLKILDSSGGLKPGFLYGNNYWLGSRSQCLDTMNRSPLISSQKILNNTQYRDPQQEFPPFEINYFVAHFKYNSTFQYHVNLFHKDVITLGLCLPASCSINHLSFILKRILHDKNILTSNLYFADLYLIQVKNLKNNNKGLSGGALLFICVSLGLCFMTTIGTIYDIFVHKKNIQKNKKIDSIKDASKERETKLNSSSHWKRVIEKIIICFSAYTNTRKIFSTKLDAETIPVIHGLKFLNMCMIIIGHSIYFTLDSVDNKIILWRFIENLSYLFDVFIGFISVDIYFFSSGFLVTYLYLRDKILTEQIRCKEKLTEFFIHIIKRFIRLTPAYMMVLGILQLSSAWFDKVSQIYMYERSHEICAKYWWRNLLYINNFFGIDAMCMSWSWYLADEMQFYIITVAILILSTMYFYAAVMILGALLISSSILSGYISYIYTYVPTYDELYRLRDILYIPPWTRINSYIIGIIAGYILLKLNNNLLLKRKTAILCWCIFCLASACNIFVLFNKRFESILATAIYIAFHKILWAIGIAWIVIACSTKHGGIINKFLSLKIWIPFSRLTYCAYLLNPVVIRSINYYSETPIHFEFLSFIIRSVGNITISYLCAYILSLVVEMPSILLTRTFM